MTHSLQSGKSAGPKPWVGIEGHEAFETRALNVWSEALTKECQEAESCYQWIDEARTLCVHIPNAEAELLIRVALSSSTRVYGQRAGQLFRVDLELTIVLAGQEHILL